jgi:hypothetical protein
VVTSGLQKVQHGEWLAARGGLAKVETRGEGRKVYEWTIADFVSVLEADWWVAGAGGAQGFSWSSWVTFSTVTVGMGKEWLVGKNVIGKTKGKKTEQFNATQRGSLEKRGSGKSWKKGSVVLLLYQGWLL